MEYQKSESVNNKKSKVELLSPAGDMECLKAAIAAGADAIYLGGNRFGARAFAGNFDKEQLLEALRLAHFWEKKIFLTVNTLTKDEELDELVDWLTPFYEAGLDGLIIQDLGVLEKCRKAFPGMLLHASTQMTVTEPETALFLKSLGVSRIVPARELSLEEIIHLKKETQLELETFIHGALCYCYSGQCLFSSFLGQRSGNRGRCAQPCRLPYEILVKEQANKKSGKKNAQSYPMSLKDLCVLEFLPKLLDAGIDSFKIEGRMKSPEYVAGVTAMYRKYIDLYEKDPMHWKVEEKDLELLSGLYVRSKLSGGYYDKHNGQEMITLEKPGYRGCSDQVLEKIREKYMKNMPTRPVNMHIELVPGQASRLLVSCGEYQVAREGMEVMHAQKKPLSEMDVRKQLQKLGGSSFSLMSLTVNMEHDSFLPVSAINELRRTALDALYEEMTASFVRSSIDAKPEEDSPLSCKEQILKKAPLKEHSLREAETDFYASALDLDQACAVLQSKEIKRLYLSADAILTGQEEQFLQNLRARKSGDADFTFFLMLPTILRSYSEKYMRQLLEWIGREDHEKLVDGLMAGSLSGVLLSKKLGWEKLLSLQHTAYVFNEETWKFYMGHFAPDTYTVPLELNRKEYGRLPVQNQEISIYGRVPMMVTANCVRKTAGICKVKHTQDSLENSRGTRCFDFSLSDRYQAHFPVLVNCRHCMNTIYNSVPLSLHQYVDEIKQKHPRALRLDFTTETAGETTQLIRYFTNAIGMPPKSYTTGHYKQGVQ